MVDPLAALRQALADYAQDKLSADRFVALWRAQSAELCTQLPPAFGQVSEDLLMRVESSRLFAGDSCSFSRQSLIEALSVWLDKAASKLPSTQA